MILTRIENLTLLTIKHRHCTLQQFLFLNDIAIFCYIFKGFLKVKR
jgi:hypothetical protein